MSISKKLRFYFRLTSAVIKSQYKIIFLGLILGVSFYFFYPSISKIIPKSVQIIKIGIVGQYSVSDIPSEVLNDLSYGLTAVSENGEALPALAENWNISDDGKTYVFKVNLDKIVWHDGKEFSANDINFNSKDLDYSVSENNLMFKLKEPFSPLPISLAKPLFKKGLIGLGDYKIKKIIYSGKYINSLLLVPSTKKTLPDKLYRFYTTESDLKTGFNLGEINTIENLFNISDINTSKSIVFTKSIMENAYIGLFFDTENPPFSNKSFRQALAYAIEKAKDPGIRALGPINPRSWAYNVDVKPYVKDLAHSQELLKGEKVDESSIITISTFPPFESIANSVRDNWKEIGINSEVKIISAVPETFQVLIIAREIPKDPDQYYFWHSTQDGNISNFKNPRIDKLLEDGRKTINKEDRKDIYYDFQRFLVEETPVVFLSHPVIYKITRN